MVKVCRIVLVAGLCVWLVAGCASSPEAPDIASLGLPAPPFTMVDTAGVTRTLDTLTAHGPVVLLFFCNT